MKLNKYLFDKAKKRVIGFSFYVGSIAVNVWQPEEENIDGMWKIQTLGEYGIPELAFMVHQPRPSLDFVASAGIYAMRMWVQSNIKFQENFAMHLAELGSETMQAAAKAQAQEGGVPGA